MANDVTSAVEAIRLMLGDTNTDTAKQILLDADYEPFILPHCDAPSTFTLQRVATGYYAWQGGPLAIFGPTTGNSPFTTTATEWQLTCAVATIYGAPSLKLTAGSDTASSIVVTGSRIRGWTNVLCDVLTFIATHKAKQYSQSIAGATAVSPETARAELLAQVEVIRGVRAL